MSTVDLKKYCDRLMKLDLLPYKGSVVRAAGLAVESKGPPVGVGQLCEIWLTDGRRVLAEVVGFHGTNRVLVPLDGIDGIAPNDPVVPRRRPRCIPLGEGLLGRVVDGLGRPIDGLEPIRATERRPLESDSPPPLSRKRITQPLAFGIRGPSAQCIGNFSSRPPPRSGKNPRAQMPPGPASIATPPHPRP